MKTQVKINILWGMWHKNDSYCLYGRLVTIRWLMDNSINSVFGFLMNFKIFDFTYAGSFIKNLQFYQKL